MSITVAPFLSRRFVSRLFRPTPFSLQCRLHSLKTVFDRLVRTLLVLLEKVWNNPGGSCGVGCYSRHSFRDLCYLPHMQ